MPSVNVTINGKNRVKVYAQEGSDKPVVFLENDQEFGLELFNPTEDVLLAKIKMNGDFISDSGLIIKPGERVFLNRYIDSPKKFKFSTYKVEDGNTAVDKAIAKNGKIEVLWYKENKNYHLYTPLNITWTNNKSNGTDWITPTSICYNDNSCLTALDSLTVQDYNLASSNISVANSALNSYVSSIASASLNTDVNGNTYYSHTSTAYDGNSITTKEFSEVFDANGNTLDLNNQTTYKETGRVEQGSKSNQKLEEDNTHKFEYYVSYQSELQILPRSVKDNNVSANELEDRKFYCPNCGKKLHKKYKFCPNCGTKI